ncbi:MAG: glycosyltransferase family 4 protein [Nitrospira sp. WS238]|nr:glycosyltransferase family 4 protein [Nitrospira sp. WS238]
MRITLVISTFTAGGAERVMAIMANYWAQRGVDVTVITISPHSMDWYTLDPRVTRVGLDVLSTSAHVGQAIRDNARRIVRLRRALRRTRPNVIVSFLGTTNVLTLMASCGLGIPVVVSERNDPREYNIGPAWSALRSLFYRYADAVVVQSCAIRDWVLKLPGIRASYVIPNPMRPIRSEPEPASKPHASTHAIVAMGRLVEQKGFDILVEAFSRCAAKRSDWSLIILGEGPLRANLESVAVDLGVKDRVHFVGQVREPDTILRGADLFVLSSRYEGFPNALIEAMACQLPVISTDCSSGGPRDIIRDGVDGLLVPPKNVAALASALDRLMADPEERQQLGKRAGEVVERFSTNRVMKLWDDLLTGIVRLSHV